MQKKKKKSIGYTIDTQTNGGYIGYGLNTGIFGMTAVELLRWLKTM